MNTTLMQRCVRAADRICAMLERHKVWFLSCFALPYLLVTIARARAKPLWFDEFATFYISRLPTIRDVWSALAAGAEVSPPLFYVVTRVAHALFGQSEWVDRFPAVLGYWIASVCIFRFVEKRSPAIWAAAAMLLPLITAAYRYAYEARPYGLMLGFCALSLLCWQRATSGAKRVIALVGLALSLGAGVSSHYYAVLLFVPLAAGEAVRLWRTRRPDWPLYASLLAGGLPLAWFLPLIEAARPYSAHSWGRPTLTAALGFYSFLLTPAMAPLAALVFLVALVFKMESADQGDGSQTLSSAPPAHEIAAALCLLALPFFTLLLAKLVTNQYTDRYAICSVIGMSVLVGLLGPHVLRSRSLVPAVLVVTLVGWFSASAARQGPELWGRPANPFDSHKLLMLSAERDLPIVFSSARSLVQARHYAPATIVSRLVYLSNAEAARRHVGTDIIDRHLPVWNRWAAIGVEDYDRWIVSRRRFLVYLTDDGFNWVVAKLLEDGARLTLTGQEGSRCLYEVVLPGRPPQAGLARPSGPAPPVLP